MLFYFIEIIIFIGLRDKKISWQYLSSIGDFFFFSHSTALPSFHLYFVVERIISSDPKWNNPGEELLSYCNNYWRYDLARNPAAMRVLDSKNINMNDIDALKFDGHNDHRMIAFTHEGQTDDGYCDCMCYYCQSAKYAEEKREEEWETERAKNMKKGGLVLSFVEQVSLDHHHLIIEL